MKINILSELKEGAWGGGNQFQKALRQEFVKLGVYEEDSEKADAILFNSFPFRHEYLFRRIAELKKAGKIIIHRVDGPISEIRGRDLDIDKIIYFFNNLLADGTVFQSAWSRTENFRLGMKKNNFETVIINAPDSGLFNRFDKAPFDKKKIKLIATSWSANPRKGFALYKFLDEHLDFSKYQMSFFGNSPVEFKNIIQHPSAESKILAEELKNSDIFITASQKDPCSNSLIEALSCGLPAVALDDGGHPEIVGAGGEVFEGAADIFDKINMITENYGDYQARIKIETIEYAARKYFDFIKEVCERSAPGGAKNNFSRFRFLFMLLAVDFWKIKGYLSGAVKRIFKS
jgi:glycosyltransferase involved in cell wall biosynthesis